jgi:hypothetical protein
MSESPIKVTAVARVVCCLLLLGCNEDLHPRSSREVSVVAANPTDSLVRLMRKSLSTPNPHVTVQEVICEMGRIYTQFGEEKADRLIQESASIAYTWKDHVAIARRDSLLHGHSFGTSECSVSPSDPGETRTTDGSN